MYIKLYKTAHFEMLSQKENKHRSEYVNLFAEILAG